VVLHPLPHTYINASDIPTSYDPNDVGGLTLVTSDLNQHIPQYCGSCWAHAPASSLADRIKIRSKGRGREVIPSIQNIIDCSGMGCQGGDSNAAHKWIHDRGGVPDVTCQQYQAKNGNCTAQHTCMNCGGPHCWAVKDYPTVKITEYGSVSGDVKIQAEVLARGPVSCYIDASVLGYTLANMTGYTGYTGGVANYTRAPRVDHAIQIAGWGVSAGGQNYWIGRNSWGTYWGEHGWFRIARAPATGSYITYEPGTCYWAVPEWTPTGPGRN
jgi:cathepsin X